MAVSVEDQLAMKALRELRARSAAEGWGASAFTTALAYELQVDYEAAVAPRAMERWIAARDRGTRLAHRTVEQTFDAGVR